MKERGSARTAGSNRCILLLSSLWSIADGDCIVRRKLEIVGGGLPQYALGVVMFGAYGDCL